MKLSRLEDRRKARVRSRKKHYAKYVYHRKHDNPRRRDYNLRKFRADKKAIRKLDRLIAAEKQRIADARRIDWNGYPPLTHKPLLAAVRVALTVDGLYVSSTNGGSHSPTSWHYKDRAVDFGSNESDESPEKRAQQRLLERFGASYFAELFGPCDWHVKNGVLYPYPFPDHDDHLHLAVA